MALGARESAESEKRSRPAMLRYEPYHQIAGRANVIADGSPTDGTVLCLTHWPGIAGPAELQADLSAEMAFKYLRTFDRHDRATVVSNNHFDQDGLVSVFALAFPEAALEREGFLIDVARAGDFATFASRGAARVSMTIAAYADPERSPMTALSPDYPEQSAQLYEELLDRLPELCDHPERFRALWSDEDEALAESESCLETRASIEEVPDLDLAVVTVPRDAPRGGGHRFGGMWAAGLHPMALYNATSCLTVLVMRNQNYELTYRYESWVQYRSRRPRPRVDLAPLVARLNADEEQGGKWAADPVSELTPTVHLEGAEESSIAPGAFRRLVEEHLRTGEPAWDPYEIRR